MFARKPPADLEHRCRDLLMCQTAAVMLDQCRRGLPEGTSVNPHRKALDTAIIVELNGKVHSAPTGDRAHFGGAVFAIQVVRRAQ